LNQPRLRQLEAERTHSGEAAVAFPDERGDLPRDIEVARTQVHVERDKRRPHADQHPAGRRMKPRRAEVGRDFSRVDSEL
jgi:hypothetical protein